MSDRTNPSIWRTPDLSLRWWPVFLRNLLVWRKLAIPSLVGNIAEPLMWLVAFGYGLGSLVGTVQLGEEKVRYILFLASGSICMSAMNAASFEALYSAFSRMHVQKTWDSIMNAPIGLRDVLLAEMLWAAFKSLFSVTAILGVMLALDISRSPMLLVAWPPAAGGHHVQVHRADLQRAGPGLRLLHLLLHAVAHADDVPLRRVFPREQLPPAAAGVGWLPLTKAVELVRPLFMTRWPADPLRSALV